MDELVLQYDLQRINDSILIQNFKSGLTQEFWLSKSEIRQLLEKTLPTYNGKYRLVLFIQKGQCISCVKSIVMDFELLQQETGFEQMYILGDFKSKEDLDTVLRTISPDLNFKSFHLDINLPFFCEYPSCFLINEDFQVIDFFIPGLLPDLRETYFYETVIKYLKLQN
mgnify:CR=1 FL=1